MKKKMNFLAIGIALATGTAGAGEQKCSLDSFTEEQRQSVYSSPTIELATLNAEDAHVVWQDILYRSNISNLGWKQPCLDNDSCYGKHDDYNYHKQVMRDPFDRVSTIHGRRDRVTEKGQDDFGWEMTATETAQCVWNVSTRELTCKMLCTLWQAD